MTTKTRRDLVDQALSNLGVLASGQTPNAEDVARMDGYVDPVIEELAERRIVEVDDLSAIPSAWFLPLSYVLSGAAASDYGAANDPRIILLADRGEKRLHEMMQTVPTYNRAQPEYF
jgi:hypothetical protein